MSTGRCNNVRKPTWSWQNSL